MSQQALSPVASPTTASEMSSLCPTMPDLVCHAAESVNNLVETLHVHSPASDVSTHDTANFTQKISSKYLPQPLALQTIEAQVQPCMLHRIKRPYLVICDSGCVPVSAWMDIAQFDPDTIRWVDETVSLADKTQGTSIKAYGTVVLRILNDKYELVTYRLPNCMYCPQLDYNLLSSIQAEQVGLHLCTFRHILWEAPATPSGTMRQPVDLDAVPIPRHKFILSPSILANEHSYGVITYPVLNKVQAVHSSSMAPSGSTSANSTPIGGSSSPCPDVDDPTMGELNTNILQALGDPRTAKLLTNATIQHILVRSGPDGQHAVDDIHGIHESLVDTMWGCHHIHGKPSLDDTSTVIDHKGAPPNSTGGILPDDLNLHSTTSIGGKIQNIPHTFQTKLTDEMIQQQIWDFRQETERSNNAVRTASSELPVDQHHVLSAPLDARDLSVAASTTSNMSQTQEPPKDWHAPLSLTWMELHKRLGHASLDRLLQWLSSNDHVKMKGKQEDVRGCPQCMRMHQNRTSFPGKRSKGRKKWFQIHWTTLSRTGALFFGDTAGPYVRGYLKGHKYAHGWISQQGYIYITTSATKDASDVLASFQELLSHLPRDTVKHVNTDGGGEFVNEEFQYFCASNGIRHTWTVPDTPEQNSNIERAWQTCCNMATAMLVACGLPSTFWPEALAYAAHCVNAFPKRSGEPSVLQQMYGFKPQLHRMREFGCTCIAWVKHKNNKEKFTLRGVEGIYLGWSIQQNGYLIYDVDNGHTRVVHTVKFFEGDYSAVRKSFGSRTDIERAAQLMWDDEHGPAEDEGESGVDMDPGGGQDDPGTHAGSTSGDGTFDQGGRSTNTDAESHGTMFSDTNLPKIDKSRPIEKMDFLHPLHLPVDTRFRSDRTSRSQKKIWDGPHISRMGITYEQKATMRDISNCEREKMEPIPESRTIERPQTKMFHMISKARIMHTILTTPRPIDGELEKAIIHLTVNGSLLSPTPDKIPIPEGNKAFEIATDPNNPLCNEWSSATLTEVRALLENNTWTSMKLPIGRSAIKCKWVYALKGSNGWRPGSKVRFKARLVAKGFTQIWGEDYFDTYAPVLKPTSLKLLVALATHFEMKLSQSDISTAFVQAPLEEEDIFIELPPGCKMWDKDGTPLVGRLNKALYGLKQAPRVFNHYLIKWMKEYGFHQLESDPCMFVLNNSKGTLIVGAYVDDMMIASSNDDILQDFRHASSEKFSITHFDELDDFLGMQVSPIPGGYKLDMTKHCESLKGKFPHVDFSKTYNTPLPPEVKLFPNTGQATQEEISLFRSMIGTALYIAVQIRIDVSHAVSVLSQYMLNPSPEHQELMNRVIAWLFTHATDGQKFVKNSKPGEPFYMLGLVDASYGGHTHTGKSHTGMIQVTQCGYLGHRSVSQKTHSTSSSHAEAKAAFTMSKETLFLKGLMSEIRHHTHLNIATESTLIMVDNKATVDLMLEPINSDKSKHWFLAYSWVQEQQKISNLKFAHIPGVDNVSDILTKPVSSKVFNKLIPQVRSTDWCGDFIRYQFRTSFGYELGKSDESQKMSLISDKQKFVRTRVGG